MLINKNIVEQARNADIIAFFERYCGYDFVQRGGDYRCKQHQSLAVKADRLSWYWHSKSVGGFGAIDYLVKIEKLTFREAVEVITDVTPTTPPTRQESEQPKILILPEKMSIPLRLYDYLCIKRGIDSEIVNSLIQKEKLYEDKRGNIVFVGYDEHGKARFASLRGTHGDFRMNCFGSDKRYGFCMVDSLSERLYIFESPIDAMSHASLEKSTWKQHNRLSLAGTSDIAIPFFLNQHLYTKELVFCLDNDLAGREAAVNMARKYAEKGYYTRLELPQGKDFNEDLKASKNLCFAYNLYYNGNGLNVGKVD